MSIQNFTIHLVKEKKKTKHSKTTEKNSLPDILYKKILKERRNTKGRRNRRSVGNLGLHPKNEEKGNWNE